MLIGDLEYFPDAEQKDLDIDAFEKTVIIDGSFEKISKKLGLKIHTRDDDQDNLVFSNGVLISNEVIDKFQVSRRFSIVHYGKSDPKSIYICIPIPKRNKFQENEYVNHSQDDKILNSIVSGLILGSILNSFSDESVEVVWTSETLLNEIVFHKCVEITKQINLEIKKDNPKSEPGLGR